MVINVMRGYFHKKKSAINWKILFTPRETFSSSDTAELKSPKEIRKGFKLQLDTITNV